MGNTVVIIRNTKRENMETTQYIISQIFTIISYTFLATTYYAKNRKNILMLNNLTQITFIIAYIFLEAWSGLVMAVVALLRNVIFLIDENKSGKRENVNKTDIIVLVSIYFISIISSIFTYDGVLSLLPVLATMLYTYAVCQKNVKTYKLLGIIIETLWTFYNIYIKSLFGIILQVIMLASCVIGYILESKKVNIQ